MVIISSILSVILVLTALFSLEARSSIRSILSFAAMNLFLALLFLHLEAPYVAVFQLLIYFGVALFLLLVVIGLGERGKGTIERNILFPAILLGFIFTFVLMALSLSTAPLTIPGYQQIPFAELSTTLWDTYSAVLLIAAYIVAFSVLGSLTLISLREDEK